MITCIIARVGGTLILTLFKLPWSLFLCCQFSQFIDHVCHLKLVTSVMILDIWSCVVTAYRCLHSSVGVSETVCCCQRERPQIQGLAYQHSFLSVPSVCQLDSIVQSSHILKFKLVVLRKDVEGHLTPKALLTVGIHSLIFGHWDLYVDSHSHMHTRRGT